MREALNYLTHAYETNSALLRKGEKRGVDRSLIAVYRRKGLTVSKAIFEGEYVSGPDKSPFSNASNKVKC